MPIPDEFSRKKICEVLEADIKVIKGSYEVALRNRRGHQEVFTREFNISTEAIVF